MGSSKPPLERECIETGGEPGYHVSEIRIELDGDGNATVYAYHLRHGNQLHLLFTATVATSALIGMGRQAIAAATGLLTPWGGDAH